MSSTCALCLGTRKLKGAEFTSICCIDVAEKIKQGYEDMESIPLARKIFQGTLKRTLSMPQAYHGMNLDSLLINTISSP